MGPQIITMLVGMGLQDPFDVEILRTRTTFPIELFTLSFHPIRVEAGALQTRSSYRGEVGSRRLRTSTVSHGGYLHNFCGAVCIVSDVGRSLSGNAVFTLF